MNSMNQQPQVITIKDKQYRVDDLNNDQIEILNTLMVAEGKIANARRELALFQAGRDAMVTTLELLIKDLTPVESNQED